MRVPTRCVGRFPVNSGAWRSAGNRPASWTADEEVRRGRLRLGFPPMAFTGRALGLDVGTKTVGLALSDELGWTAQGLKTLRRTKLKEDVAHIAALCEARGVTQIIAGLPLNMDASEGPRAQATRSFASALEKATGLPVTFWDERLTTVAANRTLLEADVSRARRREVVDQLAAQLILQGWMDAQQHRAGAASTHADDFDYPEDSEPST